VANFDKSVDMAKQSIINFLKDRMTEKNITQYKLAQLTGISEAVLSRSFKGVTEMSLITFLKICGALEIRPYFIPVELDKTEVNRIFFN
jgi:transcriptional regulator with XRE-family HTH domain